MFLFTFVFTYSCYPTIEKQKQLIYFNKILRRGHYSTRKTALPEKNKQVVRKFVGMLFSFILQAFGTLTMF